VAFESDLIEPAHNEVAATVVLIAHQFHRVFAAHERFDGGFLRDDGRTEHRVLVHLHHRLNERRRAARVTDAPAGHRERLGKSVQENRAFLHAGNARDARVHALKRQLGINFVAQHDEIFFHRELRDGFDLRAVARAAGGIARQVEHQNFAARLPCGAERVHGEREAVLRKRRHGHGDAVRERDARRIADVARLVIHHLVAGIDERAAGEVEAFADADGDDDFIFRRVDDVEILLDVFADGTAQFDEAEVGRVMRLALFERVDAGLADVPGRVEIRFADAERDGVLHLGDDVKKIADARLGQVDDVLGNKA